MANNNGPKQVGIKNSWSLLTFARAHGKMKIGDFVNKETGETFKSCAFDNGKGDYTFVSFSSNLGVRPGKWIAENKDNLQVVELKSGNYSLCLNGTDSWETVDLGI